jgi:integrase
MKVKSRMNVSYSWEQTLRIVEKLKIIESLGQARREQYSVLFLLAAASGLRIGELLALRSDDLGKNTVRVDESLDRAGVIGPCKNEVQRTRTLSQRIKLSHNSLSGEKSCNGRIPKSMGNIAHAQQAHRGQET